MKKFLIVLSALCVCLSGCAASPTDTETPSQSADAEATTPQADNAQEAPPQSADTEATAAQAVADAGSATGVILFDGDAISATGAVTVDGNAATITAAGSYEISGTLHDGVLVVDTKGDVTLILNNAEIRSSTMAPIHIKDADSVFIQLADGSENSLTNGASQRPGDAADPPDAALFSKADLVIGGSGALTVNALYGDGIDSKDTLFIQGGTIQVSAPDDGVIGKDYFLMNGGSLSVTAGDDGVKATNDAQIAMGYVEINGGALSVKAGDEGVSAETSVTVTGGKVFIDTDNNGIKADGLLKIDGGTVEIVTADDGLKYETKEIGPDAVVTVNGVPVA